MEKCSFRFRKKNDAIVQVFFWPWSSHCMTSFAFCLQIVDKRSDRNKPISNYSRNSHDIKINTYFTNTNSQIFIASQFTIALQKSNTQTISNQNWLEHNNYETNIAEKRQFTRTSNNDPFSVTINNDQLSINRQTRQINSAIIFRLSFIMHLRSSDVLRMQLSASRIRQELLATTNFIN